MFGTWRLLLALEVVLAHLLSVWPLGGNAVFSFFVLSGFLMTAIMQKSYGYTPQGRKRFALNRALRLLPNYWFAAALSLILILILGSASVTAYKSNIGIPDTALEWFEAVFMVIPSWKPLTGEPRLVHQVWALTVEIFYYALICFGLSRTKKATRYWFFGSLTCVVLLFALEADRKILYNTILAGSFPFAAGAMAWHYRETILAFLDRLRLGAAGMVGLRWLYLFLFYGLVRDLIPEVGPMRQLIEHGTVLLCMAVVVRLHAVPRSHPAGRIDELLGAYSYPVYLLHWSAGLIAGIWLYGAPPISHSYLTLPAFLIAMPILFVLSSVCVFVIDKWANRLRSDKRPAGPAVESAAEARPGLAVTP